MRGIWSGSIVRTSPYTHYWSNKVNITGIYFKRTSNRLANIVKNQYFAKKKYKLVYNQL